MSNRKKKPSTSSLQKTAEAQRRNEFTDHLKEILDKAVGPGIFRLIPRKEVEQLYNLRCHPVKVKAGPQQNIPAEKLKELRSLANLLLKNSHIHLPIGALPEMSLYDYFSIGFTILLYALRITENAYPHAAEVKKALAPFAALENSVVYNKGWKQYGNIMTMIGMFNSNISQDLYVLKNPQNKIENGAAGISFILEVYKLQAPKTVINIDGHTRPVVRLSWPAPEPEPMLSFIGIPPETLELPSGPPLNIYIQSHALNRLTERIDGFHKGVLHFNIIESLKAPQVIINKYGTILFEYRILGEKAGYFQADIIDNQIIFRTFLFLTNNGTPEAERLHSSTGLLKEDKTYLTIDKLSTFINSDIANNSRVKKIFVDAGCESLFQIDKDLYLPPDNENERTVADFIARYLQLDNHIAK